MINSYPSIYALGHKYISELLLDPVLVEEKVDGSQFSFGRYKDQEGHEYLNCRSKGAIINMTAPEGMFIKAVEAVNCLDLRLGWTYRAEYLAKPKHNSLSYDRIPKKHLIIFDINTGLETYLSYEDKKAEAERLGLDIVPILFEGMIETPELFRKLLDTESILGGQKIEGVVIKNYSRFGQDKKALFGKFVSEHFKEVHAREWKTTNPSTGDVIQNLINEYKTPARWQKAVQHLTESGAIESSPKDIELLMREVPIDIEKECVDEIKEKLFEFAWPKIKRGVIFGLPEWYKERLLEMQFNKE